MRKEGEKNNNQRQSKHHTMLCAIPWGNGHDGAFKDTTEGQVWEPVALFSLLKWCKSHSLVGV